MAGTKSNYGDKQLSGLIGALIFFSPSYFESKYQISIEWLKRLER